MILLPSRMVRLQRQQRDKGKINPWSTGYLRALLLFNKCCNGWISNAKCTLQTNCMIAPFWKLLSSTTHQQGACNPLQQLLLCHLDFWKEHRGQQPRNQGTHGTWKKRMRNAQHNKSSASCTSHYYQISLESSGRRSLRCFQHSAGFYSSGYNGWGGRHAVHMPGRKWELVWEET